MIVTLADSCATQRALDGIELARKFRVQAEAHETEWLAELAGDPDPYRDGVGVLGKEWIVEDVACTLQVSSIVAAAKLHTANQLATRFPATFDAIRGYRLELRHATRFVEAAEKLPDALLPALEADVLARSETQTITQFSARMRRLVAKVDPRGEREQHEAQREQRRVVFTAVGNGMTELWALLPAENAAALRSVIEQAADKMKGTDDRTADQRRADALCDLATGGHGLHPTVHVTMPLPTLLDLNDHPGELDGHGPVPAAIGRALAFDPTGTWRRLLTDPAGNLVDVTSRRYRPPAPMERFVELRDRTCRFPTCRRRAEKCEIDHVVPWLDGGPTTPSNLIPLCSRHHHPGSTPSSNHLDRGGDSSGLSPDRVSARHSAGVLAVDRARRVPGPCRCRSRRVRPHRLDVVSTSWRDDAAEPSRALGSLPVVRRA